MNNKERIISHNTRLQNISNELDTLPEYENIDSELDAQELSIADIKEALVGKVEGATATADTILEGYSAYVGQTLINGTYLPKGQYVWKKSEKTSTGTKLYEASNISATIDGWSGSDGSWSQIRLTFGITLPSFDVYPFNEFFDGFKICLGSEEKYQFIDENGTLVCQNISTGKKVTVSLYLISPDFVLKFSEPLPITSLTSYTLKYSGTKVKYEETFTFVDYVVSNNSAAYPNGGTQDGWWYEKLSTTGKYAGEITLTSDATYQLDIPKPEGFEGNINLVFIRNLSSASSGYVQVYFASVDEDYVYLKGGGSSSSPVTGGSTASYLRLPSVTDTKIVVGSKYGYSSSQTVKWQSGDTYRWYIITVS